MGVKGFRKIIEMYAKKTIKETEFKDYRGKLIPIDAPLMLYKFLIALINTEHYKSPNGEIRGHLFACFFKTLSMMRYGIFPLWVFDGKPPEIKYDTLNERRRIKQNALIKLNSDQLIKDDKLKCEKKTLSITSKQIDEIKYLLTLFGLPYAQSPGEAEAQCAAFDLSNISNGVVTEDWDAIMFGCKKMLKDFSNKSKVKEINSEDLLKTLGMNREQLIDLGAILGNDYCSGIGGLKPVEAYKKFKDAHFNIYKFLDSITKENEIYKKYRIPTDFIAKCIESKEYYLNAHVVNPNKILMVWSEPNYEGLYDFLVTQKKFDATLIVPKINELKLMHHYYNKNKNHELITLSKIKKDLNINSPFLETHLSDASQFALIPNKFSKQIRVRC